MEISKIEDDKSLTEWLDDKPHEWAQAIAARVALRVAPLGYGVVQSKQISEETKRNFTLPRFRANLISSVARDYPTHEITAAASAASDDADDAGDAAYVNAAPTYAASDASYAVYAIAYTTPAAARAAGYAAAAAGAASYEVWDSIQADCEWLTENGGGDLMKCPLWLHQDGKMPIWMEDELAQFTENELVKESSLGLITDWYKSTLDGIGEKRFFNPEIEREIVLADDEFWQGDPVEVMDKIAKIAGWERGGGQGSVPGQKAASVRPVWNDNRLGVDDRAIDMNLRIELGTELLASLKAEMENLAIDVAKEGNIDKRPADYIDYTAALIPDNVPNSKELFRLIRREATLQDFRRMVQEQWPDFLASRFGTMVDEFTSALDHFEDRREFNRNLIDLSFTDSPIEDVKADVIDSVTIMRSDLGVQRIEESVPQTIESIRGDDENISDDNAIVAADELESLANVFKELALKSNTDEQSAELLKALNERYNQGMREGVLEGAEEAGRADGKKIGKSITRASKAKDIGSASGSWLSKKYPKIFGWLDKR